MNPADPRQTVALFRYGLIAEFVHLPRNSPGLYAKLRQKAEASYAIPGSTRSRVALETLRDWLKRYRRGGFDALLPKPRTDRGRSRALPPEVAERLIALKEASPELSIPQLLRVAIERGIASDPQTLPRATVHRLFSRAGLMTKTAPGVEQDRRRFAFAHAGELWMSDVMHGPTVATGERGQRRKAYLIAFLDDATRVIPHAAFAFAENTTAFLPIFKQALLRRGKPARLYVDNGANYRSQHLALVCAKLGITLIHSRPHQPEGRGKQERWFRTVRAQFLTRLTPADTDSLDALNRRLWTWIEGDYHQTPHAGLDGRTPLDQWARCADQVKLFDIGLDLDALFLFETKRRVQRDRTISLNGTVFEVDATLVGQTVTLRFDPTAPPSRGIEVWHENTFIARATPLDAYANCFVRRSRPARTLEPDTEAPAPQPSGLALRTLHSGKARTDDGKTR
jgi:transposase InsO family protein